MSYLMFSSLFNFLNGKNVHYLANLLVIKLFSFIILLIGTPSGSFVKGNELRNMIKLLEISC